jgi:hypothetical protein
LINIDCRRIGRQETEKEADDSWDDGGWSTRRNHRNTKPGQKEEKEEVNDWLIDLMFFSSSLFDALFWSLKKTLPTNTFFFFGPYILLDGCV